MQTLFTTYDIATGEVRRTGVCPESLVEKFVKPGQGLIKGVRASHLEDRVVVVSGEPKVQKRAMDEIAARRPKRVTPQPTVADLMRALEKRGIKITNEEIDAARKG